MLKSFVTKFSLALGILLSITGHIFAQSADASNDALITKFKPPDRRVRDVAFSPNGKLIAASYGFSEKGGIRIWKAAAGSVVATLLDGTKEQAGIPRIAFSHDGGLFAAANEKGDVMLWNVGAWQSHKTVLVDRGSPKDLSFSPTGTMLGFVSDEVVVLYDLKTHRATVLAARANPSDSFTGISFTPDGKVVAVCAHREVWLWNIERGQRLFSLDLKSFSFFGRLSPKGDHLVAGGGPVFGKKSIQIWNVNEKQQLAELSEFKGGVFSLGISRSGKLFAVAGGDYGGSGYLSLWNLEDASEVGFLTFGKYPLRGLAFNHDDSVLAVGSEDGFVLLYAVDRIRGVSVKKQDFNLCGEIKLEDDRAFVVPLAQVPMPMGSFAYSWKLEVANTEAVAGLKETPVILQEWSIDSSAGQDRARVKEVKSLLSRPYPNPASNSVVFGYVQNPGWDKGFVTKLYADDSFVASDNSGKCLAYGSLDQMQTDFESVRKRLIASGLISIARDPLTLRSDHYGTGFIELTINGISELRSDADNIETLLKGGPAKKREAFSRIYKQEESFIKSLLGGGMKLPLN